MNRFCVVVALFLMPACAFAYKNCKAPSATGPWTSQTLTNANLATLKCNDSCQSCVTPNGTYYDKVGSFERTGCGCLVGWEPAVLPADLSTDTCVKVYSSSEGRGSGQYNLTWYSTHETTETMPSGGKSWTYTGIGVCFLGGASEWGTTGSYRGDYFVGVTGYGSSEFNAFINALVDGTNQQTGITDSALLDQVQGEPYYKYVGSGTCVCILMPQFGGYNGRYWTFFGGLEGGQTGANCEGNCPGYCRDVFDEARVFDVIREKLGR